jgi:Flp pilus assembly protein TadD
VSGITPINALIYEHWLYVGLIGPAAIAGFYLERLWRRAGRRARPALAGALVAYASFLCAQTVRRNAIWGKPLEFYQEILRYEPDDISAHHHLAAVYHRQGDLAQAERHYELAASGQDLVPQPYHGLGLLYQERGELERAARQYERALEIAPDFVPALQSLIEVQARLGRFAEALRRIEQLKRVRPEDPHVYYNSALALRQVGEPERAAADARQALELCAGDEDAELARRLRELLDELSRPARAASAR